ncbi:hypothetical protein P6U16_24040 (plasmid) [Rhizobium sp. 32-5/1]|uniref:hypothetical protein n=1 Tax=Rhizobium sp. 32-5/1 TaxID=3019602 RepID=UPI00240D0EA2|nr:hypothetical protein [Rhizobium sp. 32-5/1]WEZ86011.1 hypothetical protein P6U16_24040 [Rhizobium sp. 32-5/1]
MIGAYLRSLSQRNLNFRMQAGADFTSRIVERPGLWMSAADLDSLCGDLRTIAAKTLTAGSLTYGVFSSDRERLKDTVITVVYDRRTGKPVAFNALALMELKLNGKRTRVLHLGLVMVDPEVRSQGLSWVLYGLTCFFLFLRNQFRPLWISNVTQVPAVAGMVSEIFSDVYPSPKLGARRSFNHLLLARQISQTQRHVFGVGPEAGFDESEFVFTNAYTGGSDDLKKTFDAAPKHRDAAYNLFCAEKLDYARGDDFLQLGKIDLKAAKIFLVKSVPRGSLAALAISSALILLQRIALPVLYWVNPSNEWGILRPWKERR